MRRVLAIVGSAVFLVIAPGFVAGLVPWWISHWRIETSFFGIWRSVLLVGYWSRWAQVACWIRLFAVQGLGTPAPVFPTRHLVVTGLYRFVRNPMYVAVVSTILGQALILGSVEYAGFVWLLFHVFVLVYEEPTLRGSFGSEYQRFCAAVPRWIPRSTAWKG